MTLFSILGNILSVTPPQLGLHPPSVTHGAEDHTACITPATMVIIALCQGCTKSPLAPCVSLCTSIGAICGNYNILLQTCWNNVVCHGKALSVFINISCLMQCTRRLVIYVTSVIFWYSFIYWKQSIYLWLLG